MRRLIRTLALCLALAAALPGCCETNTGAADAVELFAVNVGKGDALILRADGSTGLIDTGKASALGRVVSALKRLGVERLDAVFITHTDDDHAGGLEWLAPLDALPVGA